MPNHKSYIWSSNYICGIKPDPFGKSTEWLETMVTCSGFEKKISKLLMFGINSAAMHLKFIKILGIGWSKIGFLSLLMFFFSSQ